MAAVLPDLGTYLGFFFLLHHRGARGIHACGSGVFANCVWRNHVDHHRPRHSHVICAEVGVEVLVRHITAMGIDPVDAVRLCRNTSLFGSRRNH